MPAFSPTIGRFQALSPRGAPLVLWYKRNKRRLWGVFSLALIAAVGLGGWTLYQRQSVPLPGGVFTEGMIGQPLSLNPLFSTERPIDDELTSMLYRGLLQLDERQQLQPDLAERWDHSPDGKTYTLHLGDHYWHDGTPVTAADVAFTVALTQDPSYKGYWSKSFTDVAVATVNARQVTFTLKETYAPFAHNLTMGLLPHHLLKGKSIAALASDQFNLRPMGTGAIRFKELQSHPTEQRVESMTFDLASGYIDSLVFRFYPDLASAINDFKLGKLQGIGGTYGPELDSVLDYPAKKLIESPLQSQSYALYFNLRESNVKDLNIRRALAYGLPKDRIIDQALQRHATKLESVYPAFLDSNQSKAEKYSYDKQAALDLLNQATSPEIRLLILDKPIHHQTAKEIQKAWQELGITTKIIAKSDDFASTVSSQKGYDLVLLGEQAKADPDRYANWHTTQKPPAGLNISGLENKRVDKALEDGRKTLDQDERLKAYEAFQVNLAKDLAVIWLYQPHYEYVVSNKVYGLKVGALWHAEDRFRFLDSWYLNEERRSQ
jgi:peptide/nickel transport system substrate-binding protein